MHGMYGGEKTNGHPFLPVIVVADQYKLIIQNKVAYESFIFLVHLTP
jgi:hypothetical protein